MDFKTDLSARRYGFRFFEAARRSFDEVQNQSAIAVRVLPTHRDLVERMYAGAEAR
jgi:hypothetical protein